MTYTPGQYCGEFNGAQPQHLTQPGHEPWASETEVPTRPAPLTGYMYYVVASETHFGDTQLEKVMAQDALVRRLEANYNPDPRELREAIADLHALEASYNENI